MPECILVVEDEPELLTVLCDNLSYENYRVVSADTGARALELAAETSPDLVLLDVMLPTMSGFEVCQRLRRTGFVAPIIMLTARNTELDRIAGLELGANDYVGKPFSIRELIARVRAHLRRFEPTVQGARPIICGDLVIDLQSRCVRCGVARLMLSSHEFDLLRYFVTHSGAVVTRHELLSDVWGYSAAVTSRTVDNFVAKLRRKVEPDPDAPRYIVTIHGVGYQFLPDSSL